jgi:hypothetical protein
LRALLAAPLEGISELAEKLFRELVTQCRHEGVIQCHHIAIDSTAIEAYEKKQPISRCQNTDHASWGAKYDPFGNKITWFGYKIHLAVDKVNSPLLTACRDDSLWDATVSGHRV